MYIVKLYNNEREAEFKMVDMKSAITLVDILNRIKPCDVKLAFSYRGQSA